MSIRLAGGYRRPSRQIEFTPLARAIARLRADSEFAAESAASRTPPPAAADSTGSPGSARRTQ